MRTSWWAINFPELSATDISGKFFLTQSWRLAILRVKTGLYVPIRRQAARMGRGNKLIAPLNKGERNEMTDKRQITLDDMWAQERAAGRTTLDRRTFTKYAGITAAGFAMLGMNGIEDALADPAQLTGDSGTLAGLDANDEAYFEDCEKFYAACSPECQHHNLCAYVKDGKVVRVGIGKNNESAPCMRGFARVEWLNSSERLTKPLKRAGEKGENQWEEVEWDEALDLLADKIKTAIDTDGNQSVIFESHAGNFHTVVGAAAGAFTSRLGGTATLTGSLCCAAVGGAMVPMWGKRNLDTRNTIAESDYILVWGNNPMVTMGGYWERFQKCMDNGGKVIVIDPVKSESAQQASEWIAIRPTTDAALALGMLRVIVSEGLANEDFLRAHTTAPCLVDAEGKQVLLDEADETSYAVYDLATGELVRHDAEGVEAALTLGGTDMADAYTTVYDLTVAEAEPWTPEAVEKECGVPAAKVTELAEAYASAKNAMIIDNMGGFMRNTYGADAVATHVNLANFTGQVGRRGAGIYDAGGITAIKSANPIWKNPDPLPDLPKIPRVKFGERILADDSNPIDVFVSYRVSPMTQYPNTSAVKEALKKIPFVCVIDMFMTSTALYADLVLPCAAVFETEDLLWSSRSHLIQLSEKAVEAPGEAHDDLWILSRLAERLGFGDDFQMTNEECVRKAIEGTDYTYEQLKEEKSIDAMPDDFIPYEGGAFYTKSGKAEMYQPGWCDKCEGHPAVPTYLVAPETVGGTSGLDAKYPLAATQRKTLYEVHSSFANLESMVVAGSGTAHVLMNSDDASARGIANGDPVVVYNDRGEHPCEAVVSDNIMAGVDCLENGHWEQQGGSSSYVTNDAVGLIATEHCCNETLVEVRKA